MRGIAHATPPPDEKRRPLGKGDGALDCLRLGGSGQTFIYPTPPRRATLRFVSIVNDDGHHCGLEVVR